MPVYETNHVIQRLTQGSDALLEKFDPDTVIRLFDEAPSASAYNDIPKAVQDFWSALENEFGESGFDTVHRVVMLRLIGAFDSRASGEKYSRSVEDCFDKSFKRILRTIEDPDYDRYCKPNDILLKDLAICRQKMFPAGAQVVEPESGFHRALLFRGGPGQFARMAWLLLTSFGNKPFYQIHTHLSELEDFNPDGWDACYVRIAEMLELHPEIKGMWGGSWFYDPALESISPKLVYLRRRPQENGAAVFYSSVNIDGGALSKSKTRQDLYERGEYLPKAYALIWPRRQMIKWARKYKSSLNR